MAENNIIQPIEKRNEDPLFKALQVSGSRKTSEYRLTESDRQNGYYFTYYGLEVPFKVILMGNNKVEGIQSIAFGTAKDCPSRALRLCQLPSDSLCYARAGESRATKRSNEDGSKGMDSYLKGLLCSAFWDKFEASESLQYDFINYLRAKRIKTLRFNLKGDFRHIHDIFAINTLANNGFKMVGYTARDDLWKWCKWLGNHERIFLNGSNVKYTNRFKATTSLKEFQKARIKCKGKCKECGNCYHLRGATITVLIHGNGADTALNTADNQAYVLEWSRKCLPRDVLRDTDFTKAKGFITCINKELKAQGIIWRVSDPKGLLKDMEEMGLK